MSPEEEPGRDAVVGGERARMGCPCPVAHLAASIAASPWACRSYRSSRSWCRRPDAGQRPDLEVRVCALHHIVNLVTYHSHWLYLHVKLDTYRTNIWLKASQSHHCPPAKSWPWWIRTMGTKCGGESSMWGKCSRPKDLWALRMFVGGLDQY